MEKCLDDTRATLTSMLRELLDDISTTLLKIGKPIIVVDDYRWFVESLSLMAKQVSLCRACMTLLDENAVQEAYLLVRSQFNNLLWIKYLVNDIDGTHLNEFIAQPIINQIFKDQKLIEMLPQLDEKFRKSIDDLCNGDAKSLMRQRIEDCEKELNKLGVHERKPKSIFKLAEKDEDLYRMYITLYMDGSKFEHSEISTVARYRNEILPEYSNKVAFKFELDRDETLWDRVLMYSRMCLFHSYEAIKTKILCSERHLLDDGGFPKAPYCEEALKAIDMKFFCFQKAIEELKTP